MGFANEYERLCALEWMVQQVALMVCRQSADPNQAVSALYDAGEDQAIAYIRLSANPEHADLAATAQGVGNAVMTLVEGVRTSFQKGL